MALHEAQGPAESAQPSHVETTHTKEAADDSPEATRWRVEGLEESASDKGRGTRSVFRPMRRRTFFILLAVLGAINWIVASAYLDRDSRMDVPYSLFIDEVEAGNVESVNARGQAINGDFVAPVTNPESGSTGTEFSTERPLFADGDNLIDLLRAEGVTIDAAPEEPQRPFWQMVVLGFGPTILLVTIFVLVFRKMSGGMGGLGGLGRSKAKRYEDATASRVTFDDVAGIDEAEAELAELVDFLRHPDKYARLGGSIPRGVLLSGPPGTGKTLLARAVAGEAEVPFFSSSASEFIEMVVGVGASRVRNLFAEALKVAPAIIFIDELDAVGRARGGNGVSGSHDEREQTLNQILTEMDGFSGSEGVIVLAATNRPEILDSALLRPGRFDRQVVVSPPDQAGRRAILEIHTRGVPLADDVDLDALASSTPGMAGADLKNLVNEAALAAARRDHERVQNADFTDSLEKILLGVERNIVIEPAERERTAYHESGHALLSMLSPGGDPVRKISIIPRGRALGVVLSTPDNDRYSHDTEYLLSRIKMALGGRAAEEVVYGSVTTGAASDLDQATQLARNMVARWGMSEAVGLVTTLPPQGQETPWSNPVSEATMRLVDNEVKRIIDESYATAKRILVDNRDRLEALAQALLERETLDEVDAYAVAGIGRDEPFQPRVPAPGFSPANN